MKKVDRLRKAFEYVKSLGLAHSQKDVADAMGATPPNVSSALKGDDRVLTDRFITRFSDAYKDIFNTSWLLTGEGEMLNITESQNISRDVERVEFVPVFSLEAVAGFKNNGAQDEFVEGKMLWSGAKDGDFAVSVVGNSMEPRIPDGSKVLLRPYPVCEVEDLEFGRPHVIVLNDDRAMLKIIRYDRSNLGHIILESYNPDYPPKSVPVSEIRHYYLAVAVQSKL